MDVVQEISWAEICFLMLAYMLGEFLVTAKNVEERLTGDHFHQILTGPWIAKFKTLWLLRAINSRWWEKINLSSHRQYGEQTAQVSCYERLTISSGPIVHMALDEYGIDDPDAARIT